MRYVLLGKIHSEWITRAAVTVSDGTVSVQGTANVDSPTHAYTTAGWSAREARCETPSAITCDSGE